MLSERQGEGSVGVGHWEIGVEEWFSGGYQRDLSCTTHSRQQRKDSKGMEDLPCIARALFVVIKTRQRAVPLRYSYTSLSDSKVSRRLYIPASFR